VETLSNDRELLAMLAAGNEKAFKVLFDAYRNRLFHYVYGLVKSEQAAEELVMDVFMKIWMGRELVNRIDNMDAFLFRVAHNKSIDFLRAANRNPRLKELLWEEIAAASSARADNLLVEKEYVQEVRRAIDMLSPQRKKVYQMSREQEFTHDQIAEKLAISKATVNNHIVEAQRFIRNYLAKNLDLAAVILFIGRI
jgi:RNA polymerase sigma-70 factor (ECF subfamily)